MEENKFWLAIWGMVVSGIVILLISGMYFEEKRDAKLLKANCEQIAAIKGTNTTLALCKLQKGEK
jgi:hypothetical protein